MSVAKTLVGKHDYCRSEKQAEKLPKPPSSGRISVRLSQVDVEDDNDDGDDGDDSNDVSNTHDDIYADDDAADGDDNDNADGSGGKIRGCAKRGRRIIYTIARKL